MKDLMLNPDDDKDEGISTDRSHDLTSLSSSRRSSVISEQEDGPGIYVYSSLLFNKYFSVRNLLWS
jgi:hypothetical protein